MKPLVWSGLTVLIVLTAACTTLAPSTPSATQAPLVPSRTETTYASTAILSTPTTALPAGTVTPRASATPTSTRVPTEHLDTPTVAATNTIALPTDTRPRTATRQTTRPANTTPTPTVIARAVPHFDHIFVIVEENHSYAETVGSSAAPYLTSLASQYAVATNYRGVTHPSQPNYLALTGGNTFGTTDCTPATCSVTARNLADRIEAAGKTWKAYIESMPAPCTALDAGEYLVRHNPFVYFDDIRTNSTRCTRSVVPYSRLAEDLQSTATTPNYVWISPNACNDMHDCAVATGDSWLKRNLPLILNSPAWTTQSSVLFITWDEDDFTPSNHVATLVIGAAVQPGYKSPIAYNHYSLLRTVEEAWGLAPLTVNDGGAAPMRDIWR